MNINQLKYLIKEILLHEFRSSFKWSEFKNLDDPSDMREYAKRHLPYLGQGSSRIVFALPNTKYVLKIMLGGLGQTQNEKEVDVATNPITKPIIAEIYDFDFKYRWLVSETVKPFSDDAREFEKATGFSIYDLTRIMIKMKDEKDNWKQIIINNEKESPVPNKNLLKLINHPIVPAIESLVKQNLRIPDLSKSSHWGKTANGKIVILDYGYE